MRILPLELPGVYMVYLERIEDQRGSFARTFCQREFAAHGLDPVVAQCNVSCNRSKGTLRGLHYQLPPAGEAKLVRCLRGAIYDVAVDLRPSSPHFGRWCAAELTGENDAMLYISKGFGHGFQTLQDDTEVFYQMSEFYVAALSRGVCYDDPAIGVRWPLPVTVLSEPDRLRPCLDPAALAPLDEYLGTAEPL
jgi:dTDP-4-dehydrorhamnose 3,5-epimerase